MWASPFYFSIQFNLVFSSSLLLGKGDQRVGIDVTGRRLFVVCLSAPSSPYHLVAACSVGQVPRLSPLTRFSTLSTTSNSLRSSAMGFFNRRPAPVDANTATATGTHEKRGGLFGRRNREPATHTTHHGPKAHNSRPTFGQWIKATWLDILTMAIMGAIGLGVYMADPAPSRSFPGTLKLHPNTFARLQERHAD